MRTGIKIALGLFATYAILGNLFSIPEFIKGMLLGLSLFFIVVGLLPASAYERLKIRKTERISNLRKLLKLN